MGLISRVSSRTYRESQIGTIECFFDEQVPSPPDWAEAETSTTSPKRKSRAITRYGLVTSESHHRLSPDSISQLGLHTSAGSELPCLCGSGLPDQSYETENSDERLSANTSTHSLKSVSARPSKSDESSCRPSSTPTTRTTMRRMRMTSKDPTQFLAT